MRRMTDGRGGMIVAFVLGLVIATAATAGAASLITGKQIKNGTITAKDLSKAVRAQLARTGIPGPAGPAGLRGDTGPKGDTGPAGLVQAVVAHASHNPLQDPVANPDAPLDPEYGTTFTTTRSGRLLLLTTMASVALTCSPPTSAGYGGMYLDGVPVPGTNQVLSTVAEAMSFSAVTSGVVAPGSHTVTIAYDCVNGAPSTYTYNSAHTTAIVLGG